MTSLAHQTLIEHQMLDHVKDALRVTLQSNVSLVTLASKLSSVQFMAQSFERHLARLFALEEEGGYLAMVRERRPELYERVVALRKEHAEFRAALENILHGFDALGNEDQQAFHVLCDSLTALLERIDAHDAREVELLEQVLIDRSSSA
jgi:hemerythrin-like domain-containing protein